MGKQSQCILPRLVLSGPSACFHLERSVIQRNIMHYQNAYAAVNEHLELTLFKSRQRFDAISTSNLEVYKLRDWWIFTYVIFGHDESSPNNICKFEAWWILNERTFHCFIFSLFESESWPRKNQLGESSPNFIIAVVNLDLIVLEKK